LTQCPIVAIAIANRLPVGAIAQVVREFDVIGSRAQASQHIPTERGEQAGIEFAVGGKPRAVTIPAKGSVTELMSPISPRPST